MKRKKKRTKLTKADSQRIHCARQALERYGFIFGPASQKEAVRQIHDGTATRITVRTRYHHIKAYTVWRVQVLGVDLRVVYDRRRKTIVTVLPKEDEDHDSALREPS